MKRKITAMLLCLAMILAMLPTLVLAANPGSIKIDKNHYAPGERMTVTISGVTTKLYNGLYGYAAIFNDEGKEVFGLEAIEVTQDGVYFAQAPWNDDDGVGNYEIRLYTGGSYYEEYLAGTVSFTIDANIISDDMGDYSWAGTWNIDWDSNDTMTLTQNGYDVAGKIVEDTTTYTVTDKIQGNVFHGRWSDDGKTPDYPYYGGHHGPMIMWMSEDGKSFTGFWGYEAGGPPYGWSPLKGSRGTAVPIGATQPATQQPATQQPATHPTGQFTLTATPVGESEAFAGVELNWTALPNVTHYRIFRAETSGGYTIPLTDFDIQGTTFTDVNIASNKTYYYIVKPVISHSDDGNDTLGNASNEAKAFIPLAIGGSSGAIAGGSGYIRMKVDSTTINVNGENKQIDSPPVIINGRTMVPARAIVEGMNGTAEWNGNTQQVTLKALGKTVVMTIGSTSYTIDGVQKTMDVPPVVKDGRTLIPLRFAGEALGCKVNWLQKTREILIVYSLSGAAISQPLATAQPSATTQPAATATPQPSQQAGAVDKNLVGFWGGGTSEQGSGSYIAFTDDGNFMYALVLVEANMSVFFEGKYACANGTINMTNVNMSMYEGDSETPSQTETGGSESHTYSVSGDKLVVNLHESDAEAWNHFSKITDPSQILGTVTTVTQPSTESSPPQTTQPSTQQTQQSGSVFGTWKAEEFNMTLMGTSYKETYTLNSDGTYTHYNKVWGVAVDLESTRTGNYRVDGNKIYFTNISESFRDHKNSYSGKKVADEFTYFNFADYNGKTVLYIGSAEAGIGRRFYKQ